MTSTIARLNADLIANDSSFQSTFGRANRTVRQSTQLWDRNLRTASRSFGRFDGHVRSSIQSVFDLKTQIGGIATIAASALSVQKVVQYSDTWKQLEGRLKIVSESMDDVNAAQNDLFEIAQRTRQPLEGIISFYTRLKQFVPEAERAQYDFLGITESVASALAITGETGASATAAMVQFTQAIGTNFQSAGQEIRSLQEQAPRLAQALTNALGGGVKSLKQLQEEGALTRQSVLGALGSLSGEAQTLADELEKIPVTVGQALTRLDNAFLKFIGQTSAVQSGTSSLALAISTLADNFESLAKAAVGLGVIIGANFLASFAGIVKQLTLARIGTLQLQTALGVMEGRTKLAALGLISLTSTLNIFAGTVSLLGGPIGVALLSTLLLMSKHTNQATKSQLLLNNALADHKKAANEYILASDARRIAIRENTKLNIEAYKQELRAVLAIAQRLGKESAASQFLRRVGSSIGIDTSAEDVLTVAGQINDVIKELESNLKEFDELDSKPRPTIATQPSKEDIKRQKTIEGIIRSLREENEELELKIQNLGSEQGIIARTNQALRIEQQLRENGIELTEEQAATIDSYLKQLESQTTILTEQEKQQKRLKDAERDRAQALNQLGASFSSSFEDAITGGEKLSDVLQGLGQDIQRLILRTTVTAPLGNIITDVFSNSGSGIFGSLFSSFPSFATGSDYITQDTYARVHKGEAIVTASELKSMRSGGDVNVVIQNNNGSNVSAQKQQSNDGGTDLLLIIDQATAENVAKRGSKTRQALDARLNQTAVRR